MPFSTLIGNDRIKKLLQRSVAEGRIGQSLLMAGPRGVGKHQFALSLAQALNCERVRMGEACGDCVPCRKIARNEHIDVRTILRESQDPSVKKDYKSQFIKIEQTRALSEQAQFRPYEGRRRVFIIDDADCLQHQAANSLLKTLEEPPDTSLVILITAKPFALLDTIRSRCLMLSFTPLTAAEIERHLRTLDTTPDEARLRARLANGSLGRAIEIDLNEYRKMRDMLVDLVETLAFGRDSIKLLGTSEFLGRKPEKEEFEQHLDALMVLLADIFHLTMHETEIALINEDVVERLARVAKALTMERIRPWIAGIDAMFLALP